jgi:hypothetical protein
MRKLKIAGIAVAVLAVALYASFQIFFRTAVPSYEGTVTIDGLGSKVEVRTDEYGIPHLFAENDPDLFFAQGTSLRASACSRWRSPGSRAGASSPASSARRQSRRINS